MFVDIMTVYNAFKMPKDRLITDLSLYKEGCCRKTLPSPPCSGEHWRHGAARARQRPAHSVPVKKEQNISVNKTATTQTDRLEVDAESRSCSVQLHGRTRPFRGWGRRPSRYAKVYTLRQPNIKPTQTELGALPASTATSFPCSTSTARAASASSFSLLSSSSSRSTGVLFRWYFGWASSRRLYVLRFPCVTSEGSGC